MRVRPIILAALLALAGCAAPPVSSDTAPRFGEVKARFVTGRDIDVIEVRALETSAIRSAVLVLPDGTRVPAEQIDADASPNLPDQFAPAVGRASSSTTLVGQIASVALVRLPDPPAYRLGWKSAVIEVVLGDGPGRIRQSLPAPPPP
ncbi:MAG: hypothetical protein JWO51_2846 [Rhodospirillales bacterium]|nr:hypothetical protein [Rhodospirillales bacterium]